VNFRNPNITKQRDGPNMINFEKEMRDGAFDQDTPPMQVIILKRLGLQTLYENYIYFR
jgi:hypothetical protein